MGRDHGARLGPEAVGLQNGARAATHTKAVCVLLMKG